MEDDGREICLRYISKGECDRSCTRSHAPLRGHTRELVIRFIWGSREAINKKREFDGIGSQASCRRTWDRGNYQNSETQNGTRIGGGRGGGRYGQNGGGGGGRGGNSSNTNPPPTKTDRKLRAAVRTDAKEVGQRRWDDGLGVWENICEVSHRRPQEKVGSDIGAHRPSSPT